MNQTAHSSQFEQLLADVQDDSKRDHAIRQLRDLYNAEAGKPNFGLVFEDHKPESVRLPNCHPTRGAKVSPQDDESKVGTLQRVNKGIGTVKWDDDTEGEVPVSELVTVAEFGTPVYPGLKVLDTVERGGDKPHHLVIKGENLHALEMLRYTHAGKVDCIYIDPPYNTGGDLIYNDKYVEREDAYRHSKWLSFMKKRLMLAREMLKATGVIIVAIDDNEQAHLRLLMDEIFGERQFIAQVIWEGNGKNDSRYISVGHDYMTIYAKSADALRATDVRWRELKPGVDEVLEAARVAWEASWCVEAEATKLLKKWFRELPAGHPARDGAVKNYNRVDSDGRVFMAGPIDSASGATRRFDIIHPATGKPVKVPGRGWSASKETIEQWIAEDRVLFGEDETKQPNKKLFLEEQSSLVARSVFQQDRRSSTGALAKVFGGERRFLFPKDTNVLARWINIVTSANPNAIILDFFAGSGSTAHAVMDMNAADGGSRVSISVTNNEVSQKQDKQLRKDGLFPGNPDYDRHGIFHHVTKPRIATVVTGKREDGSVYSEGLNENVTFAELTYANRSSVELGRDFPTVAPILWVKAGMSGTMVKAAADTFAIADTYAVLFDTAYTAEFAAALGEVATEDSPLRDVFVVTNSDTHYAGACALLTGYELHRLYEDYLSNFEINTWAG